MIVREEYLREDGVKLTRTYSNERKYIRKVGTDEIYSEAVDVRDYEYVETDQVIVNESEEVSGPF